MRTRRVCQLVHGFNIRVIRPVFSISQKHTPQPSFTIGHWIRLWHRVEQILQLHPYPWAVPDLPGCMVVPCADSHHSGLGWYKHLQYRGEDIEGLCYGCDMYLIQYFDIAHCGRVFAWEYEHTGPEWTSANDWEIAEEVCHLRRCQEVFKSFGEFSLIWQIGGWN